ncbi:hypothetical protein OKW35_006710 [Paraburkholderia sp. MM5477-R1]
MDTGSSRQHAPASGGQNGAPRLDGPPGGQFSAQPDRPYGPPLFPRLRRGSRCGSIRARGAPNSHGRPMRALACREGTYGRVDILAWASPVGARQAEGKTSRGAGGRLRNAGQRAGAVHALAGWAAQPSRGGRGNDRQRTSSPKPGSGGYDSSKFFAAEHQSIPISNMPKSCRSLVQTACRTRGGLVCFSHNNDMRMHGWLWLKQTKPPTPQGSRRAATRGWCWADF